MNSDVSTPRPTARATSKESVRGFWLAQTVEFVRHRFDAAARERIESSFSPALRKTLGELSLGDWVERQHQVELTRAIASEAKDDDDALAHLTACGELIAERSANEFTKLLMQIVTPRLFLEKLQGFWERDHGQVGSCQVEFSPATPSHATIRLSKVAGYDHIGPMWMGWTRAGLAALGQSNVELSQRCWSRSTPAADPFEYQVGWSGGSGAELQGERAQVRERIVDALLRLSSVGFGDYSAQLHVDLTSRHPLDAAFASLNELIMAFAAEHEQSNAFRRELESHLDVIEKQRAAIQELSTPIIELWEGVLCLPVVGVMDTVRSTEMTAGLLQAIVDKKARYAIIDITGIEVMDTRTVDHFMRMAKAVRLLGAECALTGINPHIAQTVVHMGLDLSDIVTHRSLRAALSHYVMSHG
jgi:rsbT co-antagonist protein RsbR